MTDQATSPLASGPAGSRFEGQVGAHYLLSILTGAEPRGLPGTHIHSVELQRAGEDRPLDDVIVIGRDAEGNDAVLEVQAKRSVSFAPSDPIFKKCVGQIVEASKRSDFWNTRYELAIAIAKTSQKIDGPYQDVLSWARHIGSPDVFMARINRKGAASESMRTFVKTFKSHLTSFDAPADEEDVWKLLRRLQILTFDFTAKGSVSLELVKERAARALHADDTDQSGKLWSSLTDLAIEIAASGGDRTRDALVEDLKALSFRLSGELRHGKAREVIAETAHFALSDIDAHVGGVQLSRQRYLKAVHSALDVGRYVEIRGDAGVGKSAVLKHLAQQAAFEARTIVLSPNRTTPRGWAAMRGVLGFDGTARDLLSDIAASGGATLFIDNLDFFQDDERVTVIDLVRSASEVPGVSIVVTVRRDFGAEEPNWLPVDALGRLGKPASLLIQELDDAELVELRDSAPQLARLLSPSHPARDVIRNLYRLSRLIMKSSGENTPSTEADMAAQWWETADGRLDCSESELALRRGRFRVLKSIGKQALTGVSPYDVSMHDPNSIQALITSESLRDLGNDKVVFRHDVLCEWAVANLLFAEPELIDRISLDNAAPAALARGVEISARIYLEKSELQSWQSLLGRLSTDNVHGSWRRAVLLALVRSEVGFELLTKASSLLFVEDSILLPEIIRTLIAVEASSASARFSNLEQEIPIPIPDDLIIPDGPSWGRLVPWLIANGERLPARMIPDAVNLFSTWSTGMFGLDPLTPEILQLIYRWLEEIESARDVERYRDRRPPFEGKLVGNALSSLESELRTYFLLFCNKKTELAADYLRTILARRRDDAVIHALLKFRGNLANAAPAEFAKFTLTTLVQEQSSDDPNDSIGVRGPFDTLDHFFSPVSPVQGPFYELLCHAPEHGLSVIHKVIEHTVSYHSKGKDCGCNAITIPMPDGERAFPWRESYQLSRENQSSSSCATSALMALEAWAHGLIEKGDPFESVLNIVLGPEGTSAAFLLVAVDLLISHWPKSQKAAIPFLACPELLCLDRDRLALESLEYPDIFGLKALEHEPVGPIDLSFIKTRPSRSNCLENLIGNYAIGDFDGGRDKLEGLLRIASERLGPADDKATFAHPAFMASYALNLLAPENWKETEVQIGGGDYQSGYQYIPPEAEQLHLKSLQDENQDESGNTLMQLNLIAMADSTERSSPEFIAEAVRWASGQSDVSNSCDSDDEKLCGQAIVSAALIAMRDGDFLLKSEHKEWAQGVFTRALGSDEGSVYRFRHGLRYNAPAMSFAGMVYSFDGVLTPDGIRTIMMGATRRDAATSHGFSATALELSEIDNRLPRAILRCAFAASIRPVQKYGLDEDEVSARDERYRISIQTAIDAEIAWLTGTGSEPSWPVFPFRRPDARRGLRISKEGLRQEVSRQRLPESDVYADTQAAALWLSKSNVFLKVETYPWIKDIAQDYSNWTAVANGSELERNQSPERLPNEWNEAYFKLLAFCLSVLTPDEIDSLALSPIVSLPDRAFYGATTSFLRSCDQIFFADHGISEDVAVQVRIALSKRLTESLGWQRLTWRYDTSIEMDLGPAIATIFFNDYGMFQGANAYLTSKGIDRLAPFVPILSNLIEDAPCFFVALVALNLFEVSPRNEHLSTVIVAANAWLRDLPDNVDFWVKNRIGDRVCDLIDNARRNGSPLFAADHSLRNELDEIITALIRLGVAKASWLEKELAGSN